MDLVGQDGLWYDVAAASEVPAGAVRRFSAGGIDGFLVNNGGSVYAVSAICTHMGCHIRWNAAHWRFDCMCHNASFGHRGEVLGGRPLSDLPPIQTRLHNGRILVWGTSLKLW
jgi:cytochrome b6-f complex iron-sulfur subunit